MEKKMNKNCLTCSHFTWWDGDHCCIEKLKLLCESPNGDFNEEIITSLKENENCEEWGEGDEKVIKIYLDEFKKFVKSFVESNDMA